MGNAAPGTELGSATFETQQHGLTPVLAAWPPALLFTPVFKWLRGSRPARTKESPHTEHPKLPNALLLGGAVHFFQASPTLGRGGQTLSLLSARLQRLGGHNNGTPKGGCLRRVTLRQSLPRLTSLWATWLAVHQNVLTQMRPLMKPTKCHAPALTCSAGRVKKTQNIHLFMKAPKMSVSRKQYSG